MCYLVGIIRMQSSISNASGMINQLRLQPGLNVASWLLLAVLVVSLHACMMFGFCLIAQCDLCNL
jgi:hypothetical protein